MDKTEEMKREIADLKAQLAREKQLTSFAYELPSGGRYTVASAAEGSR